MKLKPLAVTVAVLAALSVAAHFLSRPPPPPASDPRVGRPAADRAGIEKAARLRITDAGGGSLLLVKQPDASWRIASHHGLPVAFDRLARFMQDLADSKILRFVTARPERLASLDFTRTQIALLDDAGREYWSVSLGKISDAGGRYVHFGTETKAYIARLDSWIETDPHFWADPTLLKLPPETIAKVEIGFDAAPAMTVARAGRDAPFTTASAPAGRRLDAGKITALLETFASLAFSDFADPADPAALAARRRSRQLRLTTFDGKTYLVALGQAPGKTPAGPAAIPGLPAPAAPAAQAAQPAPVYAFISCGDAAAPVNALMKLRAFQVNASLYAGLPQNPGDLFTATPAKP
jgi:hypothetical protein